MMLDPSRFQTLLDGFEIERLFNELGWDHAEVGRRQIDVQGQSFALNAVAQKRGVTVFVCAPDAEGRIPARAI